MFKIQVVYYDSKNNTNRSKNNNKKIEYCYKYKYKYIEDNEIIHIEQ